MSAKPPDVRLRASFPLHDKVRAAGPMAAWLFVCGLAYANRRLTDGYVPSDQLTVICPDVSGVELLADTLVAVNLWHRSNGGFEIHDFADYQPLKSKIERERERWRLKRRSRETPARRPRDARGDTELLHARDEGSAVAVGLVQEFSTPTATASLQSPLPDSKEQNGNGGNLPVPWWELDEIVSKLRGADARSVPAVASVLRGMSESDLRRAVESAERAAPRNEVGYVVRALQRMKGAR